MLGIFPGWVIDFTWRESATLPAGTAVEAYSGACADWGASHLSGLAGMARLADLAERVTSAASAAAVPLGLTSASNRCANSGVSRHIRQVRWLKLIR